MTKCAMTAGRTLGILCHLVEDHRQNRLHSRYPRSRATLQAVWDGKDLPPTCPQPRSPAWSHHVVGHPRSVSCSIPSREPETDNVFGAPASCQGLVRKGRDFLHPGGNSTQDASCHPIPASTLLRTSTVSLAPRALPTQLPSEPR